MRITIPIHTTLHALLDQVPPEMRKGHVLPESAAKYQRSNSGLSEEMTRLFNSVGIRTSGDPGPKSGRSTPVCGFHSLRHTFVSLCAAGGVPQSVVQSLVGHGSPAMTRHYTHIALETAQTAVAALPDVSHAVTPGTPPKAESVPRAPGGRTHPPC